MPANDTHPEYNNALPRWEIVSDCVSGSKSVKDKKTKYLPMPNPEDTSEGNKARYRDYVERANFVSFTGFSLEGMIGMVFKKDIAVELQSTIDYLDDNVDGGGMSLDQQAREVTSEILQKGRYGLLVDFPQSDGKVKSAAESAALKMQASLKPYEATSILNWRTSIENGVIVLSMVALSEAHKKYAADGFSYELKSYTRVLSLDDEGFYIQTLYNEKDEPVETVKPKMFNGQRWREIPFSFIGAKNNSPGIDKAPLYDIAEVNIAHYRNSADFEESSFMVGQPTPAIAGLTQSWVDQVMKGGVILGSRRAILLPEGASASLLQADSNQMPERGMEMKEEQMKKIGARIIEDSGGAETAEAAKIRFGGQNSKLGAVIGNIESAYMKCFKWALQFMGGVGDNFIEMNKLFYDKNADPQLIMARIQLHDRGVIATQDLRAKLRMEGEISKDRTDEDIDAEAEDVTGFAG